MDGRGARGPRIARTTRRGTRPDLDDAGGTRIVDPTITALLPQFIDPAGNVPLQVAILALTSSVVEFTVLASYGMFAGRVSRLAAEPRVAALLDRAAAVLLMGAGLRMAALRRTG
jgi:hypothetical protein